MENIKNADVGARRTLVEEGTEFKGSLSSSCPILVKGRIDGDISAPSLHVSSTGAVHGKVKVGSMESQGELAGEFDAEVVQLSGVIKDKTVVRAKSLEVKLVPANGKMQVVFGECALDVGEMPSKQEAIHSARQSERALANGSSVQTEAANGKDGSGASEPTKDFTPSPSAEVFGEHLKDDWTRKSKSSPPKRA